jgi:hypothetical protein
MADPTIAMVSLTTGNPDDPAGVVTALSWLIGGPASAEAFRAAMTERYGEPLQSMQPGDRAGTDEELVILREKYPAEERIRQAGEAKAGA